jgi:hypothetical protein
MRTVLAVVATVALLAGCGNDASPVAEDPPVSSAPTPTPTPTATQGTYPAFAAQDYTYTLTVWCFCPSAGTPIAVVVEGGEVTSATYAEDGSGRGVVTAGDEAPEPFRLSLAEVIEAANDTGAASVEVDWPDGQDYPSRVAVDGDTRIADDEVSYEVADVSVT